MRQQTINENVRQKITKQVFNDIYRITAPYEFKGDTICEIFTKSLTETIVLSVLFVSNVSLKQLDQTNYVY